MNPTLMLVIVGGTKAEMDGIRSETLDADEVILLLNSDGRYGGTGTIGNRMLRTTASDVLGLIHADCHLGPGMARRLARVAYHVGCLSGITGITPYPQHYVWSVNVQEATPVRTMDSCCVFMPVALIREAGIVFDDWTFDSFHCCVEDFCLTAATKGIRSLVPPGRAEHVGTRVRDEAGTWRDEFHLYRARLRRKWHEIPMAVTTAQEAQ